MKRLIFLFLFMLFCASPAYAGTVKVFSDTFNDVSQVDLSQTNADVNTLGGYVQLGKPSSALAFSVDKNQTGKTPTNVLIADKNSGIRWYSFDPTSKKWVENSTYNSNIVPNPLGVSLVNGTTTYYVMDQGGKNIHQVMYNGTTMTENPYFKVTGLSNVVSFAAISDQRVVSIDTQGKITLNTYVNQTTTQQTTLSTNLTAIRGVAVVPNTNDVLVTTASKAYIYHYDQATGTYFSTPTQTIDYTGRNVISGDILHGEGTVVFTDDKNSFGYNLNSSNTYVSNSYYAVPATDYPTAYPGTPSPIGIGLAADQSLVVGLSDGANFAIKAFGDNGTNLTELDTISGFQQNNYYYSPSTYQSIEIPKYPPNGLNMFKLKVNEEKPAGTSMDYYLRVDSAGSFIPVPTANTFNLSDTSNSPDQYVHIPANLIGNGTNVPNGGYTLQTILKTTDPTTTPKLNDIELDGYLDIVPPTDTGKPIGTKTGANELTFQWTPSDASIKGPAPYEDASPLDHYEIQFSTDKGATWSGWIPTNQGATVPKHVLTGIPSNTEITYSIQVRAMDKAGNYSNPVTGEYYINTQPLGLIPDSSTGGIVYVTKIVYPAQGQAENYPIWITPGNPVLVKAGGEVFYSMNTTGQVMNVDVEYTIIKKDGSTQNLSQSLVGNNTPFDPNDSTTWVSQNVFSGYYYPSNTQSIPLDSGDGTEVKLSKITLSAPFKPSVTYSSDLLKIKGTTSPRSFYNNKAMSVHLVK